MGKSSKKANTEVAVPAVSAPSSTASKKGKRDAEKAIEKPVNAKKQKKDIEEVIPKAKNNEKPKKAMNVPTKKNPEISSSDDTDSSDSEKEEPAAKIPAKKPGSSVTKNGSAVVSAKKAKQESSSDSDSESESEEETKAPVAAASKKPTAAAKNGAAVISKKQDSSDNDSDSSDSDEPVPATKKQTAAAAKNGKVVPASKKQDSSDSSDSEGSSDEETQVAASSKKPSAPVQQKKPMSSDSSEDSSDDDEGAVATVGKANAKTVNKESGESETDDSSDEEPAQAKSGKSTKESDSDEDEDSEDEDSEDKQPTKTPKKDMDVEMVDASKKAPKTPASNQSQVSGTGTLFVGNLSFNVGQDEVYDFFKEVGEVVAVRLASGEDGRPRGFGHVDFASAEDAQKALELNGQELLGRAVKLDIARERGAYTPATGKDNKSFQKGGKGQSHTVFVKGFDKNLEEAQIRSSLEEHFGSCGDISRVSIPKDYDSGYSKGIAYMDFSEKEAFESALELNGTDLSGYSLVVEAAKPRDDNREGGGGGGWSGGRGSGGRGSGGRFGGGRDSGGRFGGRRGGGRGDGRGGRGRGGRGGTPLRGEGKKTTFGDDY